MRSGKAALLHVVLLDALHGIQPDLVHNVTWTITSLRQSGLSAIGIHLRTSDHRHLAYIVLLLEYPVDL